MAAGVGCHLPHFSDWDSSSAMGVVAPVMMIEGLVIGELVRCQSWETILSELCVEATDSCETAQAKARK